MVKRLVNISNSIHKLGMLWMPTEEIRAKAFRRVESLWGWRAFEGGELVRVESLYITIHMCTVITLADTVLCHILQSQCRTSTKSTPTFPSTSLITRARRWKLLQGFVLVWVIIPQKSWKHQWFASKLMCWCGISYKKPVEHLWSKQVNLPPKRTKAICLFNLYPGKIFKMLNCKSWYTVYN